MNAGRHALGWLVAGNAAGLWLSLLLLFPGLNPGEWTYGRWMPVHLNVQLYGWTALPLAGWLLSIYGASRRWAEAATWAWTAALAAGVLSWLGGVTSGKIFLDWKGGALLAFTGALAFLWCVLASGWWRHRGSWTPLKRRASLAGLAGLALVPWGMLQASSPDVYPPVNPDSGGPTGASLLGSTLVVVGLLMLLPRACRLETKRPGTPWKTLGYFAACWVAFIVAEAIGGSHHDPLQIIALGLLLPWPWLVLRDWRTFHWPGRPHGWRVATLLWWALLVVSAWIAFLPGILDRMKFTHGLVAHSHLAMAGFTTSFCALLLRLTGNRFGRLSSAVAWNLAALTMVIVLAATGWAEGGGVAWMAEAPAWRTVALAVRALCGLVMLGASVHWWISWRQEPSLLTHETHRPAFEPGRRRDGRRDGSPVDPDAVAGDETALDPALAGGVRGAHGLDRSLRALHGPILHTMPAKGDDSGDRVGDHRDRSHRGRSLSRRQNRGRFAAGGMVGGGGNRCGGGGDPGDRAESGLVAGLSLPLRAAAVVAMVYAHFLIFAQFAWVELMRAGKGTPGTEKLALGVMAVAGIAAGFLTARRNTAPAVLRAAFIVAAISAGVSPWAASMPASILISLLTGAAIGTMTVSLAPLLPRWCGIGWVGLGTGVGYALCNFPPVFLASPARQAGVGAAFALLGAALVPGKATAASIASNPPVRHGILAVVAAFTALVWLDSAAFFIIQHERDLKSATWGEPLLWRNAAVHVVAAVLAGITLRRGFSALLVIAWAILATAAIAVNHPENRGLAGWIYPAGVSLYSAALVAWPGYFSPAPDSRTIARRAAWLYAVAGWFGSANGIGMVQSLHHVPAAFILLAGAVVCGSLLLRRSQWPLAAAVTAIVILACIQPPARGSLPTALERGRTVYLAEGCIHCHSRYVRPGSPEELSWGPASDLTKALGEKPVLIGNRRQGPDLANVGIRRSETWLKLHFVNPRELSPRSPMPSYAGLFTDSRGDDLIAFLRKVPPDAIAARATATATWAPQPGGPIPDGAPLFQEHCAVCHGPVGHGDGGFATSPMKRPTDLDHGPFLWTPSGPDLENRIARTIKFGVPGTDMPGHETLDDARIKALARYVAYLRVE
jgi:hypothetical protein